MPETNAPSSAAQGIDPSLFDKPAPSTRRSDPVAVDTTAESPTEVISAVPAPRTRHRKAVTARTEMTRRILRIAVPTTLVAATLVACTTSSGPPPPPTVRVERTSVTTAVSSSGSLTAVT